MVSWSEEVSVQEHTAFGITDIQVRIGFISQPFQYLIFDTESHLALPLDRFLDALVCHRYRIVIFATITVLLECQIQVAIFTVIEIL